MLLSAATRTAIALHFTLRLQNSMTDAHFSELCHKSLYHLPRPGGTCLSHQYTDANQCMADAIETVLGRQYHDNIELLFDDINAIWRLAQMFWGSISIEETN